MRHRLIGSVVYSTMAVGAAFSTHAFGQDTLEEVVVTNLTGERYRTQEVLFNTLGIGNTWSAPATWGVQVGVRF